MQPGRVASSAVLDVGIVVECRARPVSGDMDVKLMVSLVKPEIHSELLLSFHFQLGVENSSADPLPSSKV